MNTVITKPRTPVETFSDLFPGELFTFSDRPDGFVCMKVAGQGLCACYVLLTDGVVHHCRNQHAPIMRFQSAEVTRT